MAVTPNERNRTFNPSSRISFLQIQNIIECAFTRLAIAPYKVDSHIIPFTTGL